MRAKDDKIRERIPVTKQATCGKCNAVMETDSKGGIVKITCRKCNSTFYIVTHIGPFKPENMIDVSWHLDVNANYAEETKKGSRIWLEAEKVKK